MGENNDSGGCGRGRAWVIGQIMVHVVHVVSWDGRLATNLSHCLRQGHGEDDLDRTDVLVGGGCDSNGSSDGFSCHSMPFLSSVSHRCPLYLINTSSYMFIFFIYIS